MTQSNCTPGPWITQGDTYVTVNSLIIAHCKQDGHTTLEEAQANARLIAAAPELLAALELIETDKEGDGFICREAMDQVRFAIAKARGES